MPHDILRWLLESEKAPTLFAAAAGILVRYLMRPHLNLGTAIFSVAAGLSAAYFAAPVIADWLSLGAKSLGVIGWLCGMTAADVVAGIIVLAQFWAKDPSTFIDRVIGRRTGWRNGRNNGQNDGRG